MPSARAGDAAGGDAGADVGDVDGGGCDGGLGYCACNAAVNACGSGRLGTETGEWEDKRKKKATNRRTLHRVA